MKTVGQPEPYFYFHCHVIGNLVGSYEVIISFQPQCCSADLGPRGKFYGKTDSFKFKVFIQVRRKYALFKIDDVFCFILRQWSKMFM